MNILITLLIILLRMPNLTYLPILDDSDEEDKAKTDESEDSEIEFELGADETIEKLIADQLEKLGIPEQIDLGINNVSER